MTAYPSAAPVIFGYPPPQALRDPEAACRWAEAALHDADKPIYFWRDGQPVRADNHHQVLALAKAAPPTKKWLIERTVLMAGQFPSLQDGKLLPAMAIVLLGRLLALVPAEKCDAGDFVVSGCNKTLPHELGTIQPRQLQRRLAQLEEAGYIYRHYTTGAIGRARKGIDLGPLVSRLAALREGVAERAQERAEYRAELHDCSTLPETSWGGVNSDTLNTEDLESISVPVPALGVEAATIACQQPTPSETCQESGSKNPRPKWVPKPELVTAACPILADHMLAEPTWPAVIDTAYSIAISHFGLNTTTWHGLTLHLGREWAAITVALVAEMPSTAFTRSRAPTTAARRAAYLAGIARKSLAGEHVAIAASWHKHEAWRFQALRTH